MDEFDSAITIVGWIPMSISDERRVAGDSEPPGMACGGAVESRQGYDQQRQAVAGCLLGLLAAALILIDLAMLGALIRFARPATHWLPVTAVGIVFGQVAIVCAAVVWARCNVIVRVVAGFFGLAGLAHLGAAADALSPLSTWWGGVLLYAMLLLVPLLLARMRGFAPSCIPAETVGGRDGGSGPVMGRSRKSWQFSIWGLLTAMTATTILITGGKSADFLGPGSRMLGIWGIFAALACTALVTGWAILHSSRMSPGATVALAIGLIMLNLLGGLWLHLWMPPDHVVGVALLVNAVNGGTVAMAAIVLRVAGLGNGC